MDGGRVVPPMCRPFFVQQQIVGNWASHAPWRAGAGPTAFRPPPHCAGAGLIACLHCPRHVCGPLPCRPVCPPPTPILPIPSPACQDLVHDRAIISGVMNLSWVWSNVVPAWPIADPTSSDWFVQHSGDGYGYVNFYGGYHQRVWPPLMPCSGGGGGLQPGQRVAGVAGPAGMARPARRRPFVL